MISEIDIGLRPTYGLTTEEVLFLLNTLQMCQCAICLRTLDFNTKDPCFDHNHQTGRARGFLCRTCNQRVGHYEKGKTRWMGERVLVLVQGYLNDPPAACFYKHLPS